MRHVPLKATVAGNDEIVGEIHIDIDGNITGNIKRDHPILLSLINTHQLYSFDQVYHPQLTKEEANGVH